MVHYIYENLIERREEMEGAENVAIPRLGVDKFYHSFNVKVFGFVIAL